MISEHRIASPDHANDQTRVTHAPSDMSTSGASTSGTDRPGTDRPGLTTRATITPTQRWAHNLVLDMLEANLPLPALAHHLKIPFATLVGYIQMPEVQAEIDAYEALTQLRARLLGQTARPVSLRRLLDVLESPAPLPGHRDPESDQRALHRHAELMRRTATTIARESRALAPKPPSARRASPVPVKPAPTRETEPVRHDPAPDPSPHQGTTSVSERTSTRAGNVAAGHIPDHVKAGRSPAHADDTTPPVAPRNRADTSAPDDSTSPSAPVPFRPSDPSPSSSSDPSPASSSAPSPSSRHARDRPAA